MFSRKLERYGSAQISGKVNQKAIPHLKERHYYIVDIPLDGDAPKQYIKAYFHYKNCPKIGKPSTWNGFFAKSGGKSYPHESVTEFLINKIGESLGLKMNETRLIIANGQIRFLSQDFIKSGQKLIHGIEILAEYYEDKDFVLEINKDRKNRRAYLTFEEIEKSIIHVYPKESDDLLASLIQLITYDAIVGNNDRHFYNWGVIGDIFNSETTEVVFAPVYDSARALLWNKMEVKVLEMYHQFNSGSNELDYYINKSKPRFSFDENPEANHFELMGYLSNYKSNYKAIIAKLINVDTENTVTRELKGHISCFFSKERSILVEAILKKRFDKLRSVII